MTARIRVPREPKPTRRELICRVLFGERSNKWLREAEILERLRAAGDLSATDKALRNHLSHLLTRGEVEMDNPGASTGCGWWRART